MHSTQFTQDVQRRPIPNNHDQVRKASEEIAAILTRGVERLIAPVNVEALSSAAAPMPPKAPAKAPSTAERPSKLDYALELASRGFRVFPLPVDDPAIPAKDLKKPFLKNWPFMATNNPEKIRKLWSNPDFNIGLVTGHGAVVLDYDMKEGQVGQLALDSHEALGLPTDGFSVTTPTGGRHFYFTSSQPIRNSASMVAKNVDIRGDGGFVVAPGSTIHGKPYVLSDGKLQELPAWMAALTLTKRTKASGDPKQPLGELDRPEQIAAAARWLEDEAPEAIKGQGGDDTTYRVACRVKDFGISEPECLHLMLNHWNDTKAANGGPWNPEKLAVKVANAYAYGTLSPGIANDSVAMRLPLEEIARIRAEDAKLSSQEPLEDEKPLGTLFDPNFDFAFIPPRDWIVDKLLLRKSVTGLIAPGGAGKSQLACQLCVALPTGRTEAFGFTMKAPARVWYWNQEDDEDELNRRVGATFQSFGIDPHEIGDRLYLDSGVEKPLKIAARGQGGSLRETKYVSRIVDFIKKHNIDVLIVDPLVEFHEAGENDNGEMDRVIGILRSIAAKANCAVLIAAHTRKPSQGSSDGFAGEIDSLRGAGSQGNKVRVAYTLVNMSEKDAMHWGVDKSARHRYARLDSAKANPFLREPDPYWYRRTSVEFNKEWGGVLEPVTLVPKNRRQTDILEIVAKTIAENPAFQRGSLYPLSDLIEKMSVGEKAAFGGNSNRSRLLTEALASPGWVQSSEHTYCGETNYGRMTVIKKTGRAGTKVSLASLLHPGGHVGGSPVTGTKANS